MYELKFSLETLSPVVISAGSNTTIMTKSHDEISGSIIRGVLASRYVELKKLGNTAHEDENFRKLFYGDLKFLSATPELLGKRSFILPLSLQSGKKGTDTEKDVQDLLKVPKTLAGYKNLRGYGITDGEKIYKASVSKNIFMHMSRSDEVERITGKSELGHIYNYEALEEGQTFCGMILGTKDDLEKISTALNLQKNSFVAYLGRSKFTQYGKCRVTFDAIQKVELPKIAGAIYLRLDSPLIPAQDNFLSAADILKAEVVDALNKSCGKEIFTAGEIFSAGVEVENFVVTWTMKRPRVQALAAGTVFELKAAETLSQKDLQTLGEKIYEGFGTRREEGFGQVRIWQAGQFKLDKPQDKNKAAAQIKLSAKTIETAQGILLVKALEQMRIYANEDGEKLRPQLKGGNYTHFFSRLENILASVDRKNFRAEFKARLELEINASKNTEESRGSTQFEDHLKKFFMANEQTFFNVLTGNAEMPYESRDLKKDLVRDDEKRKALFKEIPFNKKDYADEICLEYLKNYFRVARKAAATAKGGR
ncbi:MAG: hypothetical protein IJU91_02215 [Selenomonadaceae bacterium]|nr:hypothetical protein [Selenomonadaceae bacterium]